MVDRELEKEQQRLCAQHRSEFIPISDDEKIGFATSTLNQVPLNGLRHSPEGGTTGWYIWCGTEFSNASDFFEPLCVKHLIERLPGAARFLGLSPGHRFLTNGEYVDVWLDGDLLNTKV
jgi:hypothetical protein